MDKFDFLIIGGGVAGVTAAENIRRADQNSTIGIVCDDKNVLYSRVSLSKPNFFLEESSNDQLWLRKDGWYQEQRIEFLRGKKAVQLDPTNKSITLDDQSQLSYDKLLIATGAQTRTLDIPGSDKQGIYYLRTLEDGLKIKEAIKTSKKALILGGGFISFEMAHLLTARKIDTTIVMRKSYFWEPTLDETAGKMIENALAKENVNFIRNAEPAEVTGEGTANGVNLKDGRHLDCDMLICAIGVVSQLDWLKSAGLQTNKGLVTNEFLEAGSDIWAAGDIAEYKDLLLGENIQMGNWVNAHEQGRVVASNMLGAKNPFKFVSFYTTQGFDITIAFVGDVTVTPERMVVTRGGIEAGSYGRLVIVGNELIGATLINRTQEMNTLAKLIAQNVDVSTHMTELADPNFDLSTLLPTQTPAVVTP